MTACPGNASFPRREPSGYSFFEFHWVASGLLAVCVIPAFLAIKLPLAVNWSRLATVYWIGLSVHSIAFSVLLFVIGMPVSQTFKPIWNHYEAQKPRVLIFLIFAAVMVLQFGLLNGSLFVLLGLLLAELIDRAKGDLNVLAGYLKPVLVPSVYLFFGLVMVFAYNDVIATLKNPSAYDWLYLRLDSYFLGGSSVSSIAHNILHRLPWLGVWAEVIYYGMFNQIGAGVIILAVCGSAKEAARYVGTLLTAYYLGLLLFFLWPSMGPFFTCHNHFSEFPSLLRTYGTQLGMNAKAQLLANHRTLSEVDTDYFIAFPCLHIAQPIIVAWYLRRWPRMLLFLIAYDVLLTPAILILEWHYFVDLFGGVLVAALAIQLNRTKNHKIVPPLAQRHVQPRPSEVPVC